MTNEPAERLRQFLSLDELTSTQISELDAALAAERRATVERFASWLERYKRSEATVWAENSDDSLEAILDADAAAAREAL